MKSSLNEASQLSSALQYGGYWRPVRFHDTLKPYAYMKQRMNPYAAYDPKAYQAEFPEFQDDPLWAKFNPWLQAERDNERFLKERLARQEQELTEMQQHEFGRMMQCCEECGKEMAVGGEEFRRHSI